MDKPKHVKATWDAVAHRVFLDVCIEEVNANNRPVQVLNALGYKNLVENFNKRTKRNYDCKQGNSGVTPIHKIFCQRKTKDFLSDFKRGN